MCAFLINRVYVVHLKFISLMFKGPPCTSFVEEFSPPLHPPVHPTHPGPYLPVPSLQQISCFVIQLIQVHIFQTQSLHYNKYHVLSSNSSRSISSRASTTTNVMFCHPTHPGPYLPEPSLQQISCFVIQLIQIHIFQSLHYNKYHVL